MKLVYRNYEEYFRRNWKQGYRFCLYWGMYNCRMVAKKFPAGEIWGLPNEYRNVYGWANPKQVIERMFPNLKVKRSEVVFLVKAFRNIKDIGIMVVPQKEMLKLNVRRIFENIEDVQQNNGNLTIYLKNAQEKGQKSNLPSNNVKEQGKGEYLGGGLSSSGGGSSSIPPKQPPLSGGTTWYHGTDNQKVKVKTDLRVKFASLKGDFGQGIYLSNIRGYAYDRAKEKVNGDIARIGLYVFHWYNSELDNLLAQAKSSTAPFIEGVLKDRKTGEDYQVIIYTGKNRAWAETILNGWLGHRVNGKDIVIGPILKDTENIIKKK